MMRVFTWCLKTDKIKVLELGHCAQMKEKSLRNLWGVLSLFVLAACERPPALPEGYFQLMTKRVEGKQLCLAATNSTLDFGATMEPCSDAASQHWKSIQLFEGFIALTAKSVEVKNQCLESRNHEQGTVLIDPCGDFNGQSWRVIEFNGTYFKLTSRLVIKDKECLESTAPSDGQQPNMDPCSDSAGQLWRTKVVSIE